MKKFLPLLLAAVFSTAAVMASPITYTFRGVADITVDAAASPTYLGTAFSITLVSDTSTLVTGVTLFPFVVDFNSGTASYAISGGPSGAVTSAIEILSLEEVRSVGLVPSGTFNGIVAGVDFAGPSIGLGVAFPETPLPPGETVGEAIVTAEGSFTFNNVTSLTYEATGGEVPEPATYALIGGGLLAFGLFRRKRQA